MGQKTCGSCGGSGKQSDGYESCSGCSGAGWSGQGYDGGSGVCSWCGGSGKSSTQKITRCHSCGGTGSITTADKGGDESNNADCFVATAVYGDGGHSSVVALRAFRDSVLQKYWLGRVFIKAYYRLGPQLAKSIGKSRRLMAAVRAVLDVVVRFIGKCKAS